MNTQNVNVKTATKESSERWVKTSSLRTDGFVRNIHSVTRSMLFARTWCWPVWKYRLTGDVACTTRFMSPVCWVWLCITRQNCH